MSWFLFFFAVHVLWATKPHNKSMSRFAVYGERARKLLSNI